MERPTPPRIKPCSIEWKKVLNEVPRYPDDIGLIDGESIIAHYWHDHRGDEHGIDFVKNGPSEFPFNSTLDFLEGGGPEPLRLSIRAIEWLTMRR